jgi:translation initiation factor 1A
MPAKNKKGGNKTKKQKNSTINPIERKLEFKNTEDNQEYAQIKKALGNSRFEAFFFDGKTRLAHAPRSLKKSKCFVKVGDVVIVSLRSFQDAKCDILYIYNTKEIKQLKKLGEIPMDVSEDINNEGTEIEVGVEFEEEEQEVPLNNNLIDFDKI